MAKEIFIPTTRERQLIRNMARAIAKAKGGTRQERVHAYIDACCDMGHRTNCCEEGVCGHSGPPTREL
jgi:hypothetical protein